MVLLGETSDSVSHERYNGWTVSAVVPHAAMYLALVAVVALLMGEHRSPVTSVLEIVGVNGMFVVLFLASAWLFQSPAAANSEASAERLTPRGARWSPPTR